MNIKLKKAVKALIACVIVAGIAITCIMGLNYELMYSDNTQVDIYIKQKFENSDIEQIVKEVIGEDKEIIIQKVEIYEDMVSITVADITDEEISQINDKVNEKYELENTVDDLVISHNKKIRGRDMVKPYLPTIGISFIIILAYNLIIYRKQKVWKVGLKTICYTLLTQALYLSIIALTRIDVNRFTIPVALAVYVVTEIAIVFNFEKIKKKMEK